MLAKDGRCKTFSDGADGYVRGEGAGVVVLSRWADGDSKRAYAFVEGCAVNQDGRTNGLTAPSEEPRGRKGAPAADWETVIGGGAPAAGNPAGGQRP